MKVVIQYGIDFQRPQIPSASHDWGKLNFLPKTGRSCDNKAKLWFYQNSQMSAGIWLLPCFLLFPSSYGLVLVGYCVLSNSMLLCMLHCYPTSVEKEGKKERKGWLRSLGNVHSYLDHFSNSLQLQTAVFLVSVASATHGLV